MSCASSPDHAPMSRSRRSAPFELKGLAAPLAACEIVWTPLPSRHAVPLPSALSIERLKFVGREAELDRLGNAWKRALAGDQTVVVVGGRARNRQDAPRGELRRRAPRRRRARVVRALRRGANGSVPTVRRGAPALHATPHRPAPERVPRAPSAGARAARAGAPRRRRPSPAARLGRRRHAAVPAVRGGRVVAHDGGRGRWS